MVAAPQQTFTWTFGGKPTPIDPATEYAKCSASFPYFLHYVRIHGHDEFGNLARIEFQRWPYLLDIAADWQAGGHFIEGKGRQEGFSWLAAAFALWKLTFLDFSRVLLLSIGQREANDLANKLTFIHDNLPPFLKLPYKKNTTEAVELWQDRGNNVYSELRNLPSTPSAGSGFTASTVITDEWAKHPNAAENFAAWHAAIAEGNGQHIAISTGWGSATMFADYFRDACTEMDEEGFPKPDGKPGRNGYTARFTPWYMKPTRTQEWYESERAAYRSSGKGDQRFVRENPTTVKEMFQATAGLVYDNYSVTRHRRPQPREYFQQPLRLAAVDPGQGDNSAITVSGYHPKDPQNEGRPLHFAYDEWIKPGTTTVEDIIGVLMRWHRIAPLHLVLVDHNEGTLLATLQAAGLPAVSALQEKEAGLGVLYAALEVGTFAHNLHMEQATREFLTYRYNEQAVAGEGEMKTSTPKDHHADVLDTLRWQAVAISQNHPFLRAGLENAATWSPYVEKLSSGEVLAPGVYRDDGLVNHDQLFGPRAKARQPEGPDFRDGSRGRYSALTGQGRAPGRITTGRRR